jgi:hypothetical protein
MAATPANLLTQRIRLVLLIVYVVALFCVSKLALDRWWPPTTEKGLWFYAGLVALLLGNLLVSPFFTKPVDALSYAVPAMIGLLAVNPWTVTSRTGFDRFLWTAAILYLITVIVAGIASIALKDSATDPGRKLARSMYLLSDVLGGPRPVCSAVFLFALVTFHRNDAREYLWIGLSWLLFIGLRPLETLVELWLRWRAIWKAPAIGTRLGAVVGHQVPKIVLIREDRVEPAHFGDLLLTRFDDGRPGLAMAVDHVGFVDGRWLRAIQLTAPLPEPFAQAQQPLIAAARGGAVVQIESTTDGFDPKDKPWLERERLLGFVAPETSVGKLRVEIVRDDLALRQGALIQVRIGENDVLFQVIDALTQEEILQQKNTRGYVRAEAKKIGCWNQDKARFEHIPWLPQPNEPAYLSRTETATTSKEAIGHFPGTKYPVTVDLNAMVTHNTAILGILGVGKSFLALELIERMIKAGIKVICLDLTDQYAKELAPFFDANSDQADVSQLNTVGTAGKTNVKKNVEEGGSATPFAAKMKEQLTAFLGTDSTRKVKILNPTNFEVWRQDSKPYQDQASMATLTPTEITRIISEKTLEVLQAQGMTDRARCCLVYEEAHSLIPEWNAVASEGDKTATNGTAKAILQGRKFGLGCFIITQRTANVTKTILNQCNTVFALRVFDATGVEFLKNYIGEDYAGVLSNLEDRHAVVFGRASSCKEPVLIRLNDREDFVRVFRAPQDATTVSVETQDFYAPAPAGSETHSGQADADAEEPRGSLEL